MNDTVKGIIIGIISGLITSGIVYAITEKFQFFRLCLPIQYGYKTTVYCFR